MGECGLPYDSVSPVLTRKKGADAFWVLEPVPCLCYLPNPLRGDSPALTPVGLQASCQEVLP